MGLPLRQEALVKKRGSASVFRTVLMLVFWAVAMPISALLGFPWTYLTKDITFLYRICMRSAWTGVRIAGIHVQTLGLDKIDPTRTYIFMSNHVSNVDPPITLPLIPRRTSVMVKKELFSYPLLGQIMRIGSLVPVDRGNRDAGITAVRDAVKAIQQGYTGVRWPKMTAPDGRIRGAARHEEDRQHHGLELLLPHGGVLTPGGGGRRPNGGRSPGLPTTRPGPAGCPRTPRRPPRRGSPHPEPAPDTGRWH